MSPLAKGEQKNLGAPTTGVLFSLLLGCSAASLAPTPTSPAPAASAPTASAAIAPAPPAPAPPAQAANEPAPAEVGVAARAEPEPLGAEALARLRPRLDALVKEAGAATLGVVVLDAQSGQEVYASSADQPRIPASTMKLLTTGAALSLLGPEHRMKTEVRGRSEPIGGLLEEVFLVGAQDFTWSRLFRDDPGEPLASLARALRARGVRQIKTSWITGEPLWDADQFQELDVAAHRAAVGARWRLALGREGIGVGAVKARADFDAAQAPAALAQTLSGPLGQACAPINQRSHNGFADALLRHLGQQSEKDSSYAAGARAVRGWLAQIGAAEGVHVEDGSGLSRANRASARSVAAVLRAMERGPHREIFRASLAAAGERGTLRGRLKGASTRGRVVGKTGTLAQVVATSGLLDHPSGRRTFVFALVANGVRDGARARRLQDRIVEELASGWLTPPDDQTEQANTVSYRLIQKH